jgi:hypothetical protein
MGWVRERGTMDSGADLPTSLPLSSTTVHR